jgi:RNA recognition motif-containing protein
MKSGVNSSVPVYQGPTNKIFIGGVAAGTMKEDIEHYFSTYGVVQEVVLMMDKQSQRPRGRNEMEITLSVIPTTHIEFTRIWLCNNGYR